MPRLLASVEGCFDEIHITDTGSNDGTVEYLAGLQSEGKLKLHHFTWVDDFGAARNASFEHAKTDYVMWLDCDDVLGSPDAFRDWKKSLMPTNNYWLATYHYGSDNLGKPTCSFMRERVFLREMGFRWSYFVHEGVPPQSQFPVKLGYATSWNVIHVRTAADIAADKSRNLNIFEKNKHRMFDASGKCLDHRMLYYYGKELFENNDPLNAYSKLIEASRASEQQMEPHDRILAIQYACLSAMLCNQFKEAINLAYTGLMLAPNRAEFYICIGDSYLKLNQYDSAIGSFAAAANCINTSPNDATFQGGLFTSGESYTHYPRNQLARIYFHKNDIAKARLWVEDALKLGSHPESDLLSTELDKAAKLIDVPRWEKLPVVDEYVITCPQGVFYPWDELEAKKRGVGGSETAVIHMARELHKQSGKVVRVFMERPKALEVDGVHYQPLQEMMPYLSTASPKAHIAWRHNMKLTQAPTYLWCHDLGTPGMDQHNNYEKCLALSGFHKEYIRHIFNVPKDKIHVTRNGIDLSRFNGIDFSHKDTNKIVFSSSPDRGMDRAIRVVERARQRSGRDFKLHTFYGFDNMRKLKMNAEADRLEALMNPEFVVPHGNVQQEELLRQIADAQIWLYPTDFLETFCITALEMVAAQVKPLVRYWGALPETLSGLPAVCMDMDCKTEGEIEKWANELIYLSTSGLAERYDMDKYSWASVAKDWLEWMPK